MYSPHLALPSTGPLFLILSPIVKSQFQRRRATPRGHIGLANAWAPSPSPLPLFHSLSLRKFPSLTLHRHITHIKAQLVQWYLRLQITLPKRRLTHFFCSRFSTPDRPMSEKGYSAPLSTFLHDLCRAKRPFFAGRLLTRERKALFHPQERESKMRVKVNKNNRTGKEEKDLASLF